MKINLVFLLLILSSFRTGTTLWNPIKVEIKSINIETSYSKGLAGVQVQIEFSDTLKVENDFTLEFNFEGKSYKRRIPVLNKDTKISGVPVFIPYSRIYKQGGEKRVNFIIEQIHVKDSEIEYKLEGVINMEGIIVVPDMEKFTVKVDFVKVKSKTKKGAEWDYSLFRSNEKDTYPDLVFIVESSYNEDSQGIFSPVIYKSYSQKNTLSAGWPSFSDEIYLCKGDLLIFCIKDVDTVFDDKIGCISIKEFRERGIISQLNFDQVEEFTGKIEFREID